MYQILRKNSFQFIWAAFFVLLFSCTSQSSNDAESESAELRSIPEVTVVITEASYDAPDSLPAGNVSVVMVNNTEGMHSAHLIHLDDGYSEQQLIDAYADASRNRGTRPDWMTHRGGPLGEPGTSRLSMNLEPGNYVWVCVMGPDTIPHFTGNEHQFLTVHPAEVPTEPLTEADNKILMTDENHELVKPLSSGPQSIDIINTGTKYHLTAMAKLNEGATAEEYLVWMQNMQGPPPASGVAATSAIGPGLSARLDLDLEPGEYLLFCFANADGVPHIFQGAIQTISVE